MTTQPEQQRDQAMDELHVYEFENDWIVAGSEAQARNEFRRWHVATTGALTDAEATEQLEGMTVEQWADDRVLRVWLDERGRVSDGGTLVAKSCGEWAKERGVGFLCTSEY